MIVYAINDKNSFKNVTVWNNLLLEYVGHECIKYLLGNKKDLENEREISEEEGENFKEKFSFKYFLETSPKTDYNLKNLIKKISISLYEKIKKDKNIDYKVIRLSLHKKEEELQHISSKEKGRKKRKKKPFC